MPVRQALLDLGPGLLAANLAPPEAGSRCWARRPLGVEAGFYVGGTHPPSPALPT